MDSNLVGQLFIRMFSLSLLRARRARDRYRDKVVKIFDLARNQEVKDQICRTLKLPPVRLGVEIFLSVLSS